MNHEVSIVPFRLRGGSLGSVVSALDIEFLKQNLVEIHLPVQKAHKLVIGNLYNKEATRTLLMLTGTALFIAQHVRGNEPERMNLSGAHLIRIPPQNAFVLIGSDTLVVSFLDVVLADDSVYKQIKHF